MDKNVCPTEKLWVIEFQATCLGPPYPSPPHGGWFAADIRYYTFEDAVRKLTHSGRIIKDYRIRNTRTEEFVLGAIM